MINFVAACNPGHKWQIETDNLYKADDVQVYVAKKGILT